MILSEDKHLDTIERFDVWILLAEIFHPDEDLEIPLRFVVEEPETDKDET